MCLLKWLCILVTFCFVPLYAQEPDFLGCGGFIQIPDGVAIDLTKVEVRLYTKQGNLKYHTDCAPNNGYYFIPIYDKGEYVIKVVSPNGWSFEPSSVSINIDKVTDECTLGKDINFIFKGFTVSGRVYSLSRQTGPAGVVLDLIAAEYPAGAVQTVTSEKDGLFAFKGVPPGQYLIRADHVSWSIQPSEVEVEVVSDSLTIKERLEVLGYEVHGHVSSEGEPIQGVEFSLYSQNRDAVPSHCGLNAPTVSERSIVEGWILVCQTVSDISGRFVFPVVPSGHYKLVPLYSGENILFDITPSSYEFDVEHDSVTLPRKFEVQGFRVSGRVLEHANGVGLIGAKVFLNGKQVTTSSEGGFYNLENIKTGVYRLTAESANLGFDQLNVRISPTTPSLPDIVASSFKVCGQVGVSDLPASRHQARKVIFIPSNPTSRDEPTLVPTDNTGEFCHLLKPGLYRLEPMALETEVAAGLKFAPSSYEIRVEQKPLSGFRFNQFRASIRGRVNVIGSDQSVPVRLTSISTPVRMPPVDAVTSEGTFHFENLLPGKYKLAVLRDEWCWKSNSIEVEITDRDLTDVTFNHIGFFLSVSSSHDVDLSYTVNGQTSSEQMKIKAGSSKHCLPQPGRYVFTPQSCHVFEPSVAEWDSSNPTLLVLKSVRHRVGVVVRSDLEIADLQVTATTGSEQKTALKLDSVTKAPNGGHEYSFVFDAQSGETVQVIANADSLLFFPSTLSLSIGRDCDDRAGTIIAQRGLYVSGVVRPAISDVQVTITGGRLAQPATVNTDAEGRYSYGPVNLDGHPILDMAATFSLTAEKRGYIIRPDDVFGDFVAEKLAEISVLVVDHSTGQPLSSVLIAAAGGVGYRQNSLTGADGRVTLSGLNPGEYFIKPVLKEYRFDPISKLVRIEDGATVEVQIKGERVAFSCFGTVTTLNGEPEASVSMEAVGAGSQQCAEYQEEANTEANGQFRIRGLKPGCKYVIRMKAGSDITKNIQRTLPDSRTVDMEDADVSGVRFVAIKRINQADVAVSVKVPEPELLKTIKLNLFRDDQPDVVLHSIKLDHSPLVILPVLPMDGRKYYLQLESTLSRHGYDYQRAEVSFTANTSIQHVSMQFNPKRKSVEATETTQVSVRSVLFLILGTAAVYYYQSLVPLLNRLVQVVASNVMKPRAGWSSVAGGNLSSSYNSSGSGNNPVLSEQDLAMWDNDTPKKKVKPRRAQ